MAGELPEFLCPRECVGGQDYVLLDYYWGIDSFELSRMPPGLSRALNRFHRWFPNLEIIEGARRQVELCVEAGVNLFDTGNSYSHGASEEILGRALEGRRSDVLIA